MTEEEIAILKDQHLAKGWVDKTLAESRADNDARTARMSQIEAEIAQLQTEIDGWESKEKERVRGSLEESCNDLKRQFEANA